MTAHTITVLGILLCLAPLVAWIMYYLMTMGAAPEPEHEHEFDSARRKMMKGE